MRDASTVETGIREMASILMEFALYLDETESKPGRWINITSRVEIMEDLVWCPVKFPGRDVVGTSCVVDGLVMDVPQCGCPELPAKSPLVELDLWVYLERKVWHPTIYPGLSSLSSAHLSSPACCLLLHLFQVHCVRSACGSFSAPVRLRPVRQKCGCTSWLRYLV